jgi:putative ABC transport system permease protein
MEQALDDELEFHLAMREEKLHEQGLSTEDAHARALTRFGDRDRIRAECLTIDRHYAREISVMEWIESVMADVRYAARTLRRAPAFTAIAVTTLALGVGATTAIFSLVDGILLRPLPYPEPQRLVRVLMSYPEKGLDSWSLSQQNVAVFRARVTDFAHLAGYSRRGMTLTSDAGAERLNALLVTNDFFPTLAVRPVLGRLPADSEVTATSAQVAVLGYGFWQTRFGASPGVIGKVLDVEGTPTRVVAVMPPGFAFPRPDVQVYVPFAIDATKRFGWFLTGIARLKPGVSAEHAERQLTSAMWTWARENPDLLSVSSIRPEATRMRGLVVSLREATTGAVARPLAVLQAAVALLLLIAVANIATLVSSRSAVRSPEIAVRTALGASARRVARQLVTESLVVAVIGGVCGIALAIVAVRLFGKWNAGDLPRMDEVSIDWRVLAFALLVSVASGILFGLAPATRMARSRRLADDLVGAQKGSVRGSTRRLNNALIVAQMALSVVLLISAGLMLKSFRRLTKTELGFEPRGVVSMTVPLPMKKYMDAGAAAAATQTIVERVRAIPGVRSAAAASGIPYSGSVNTDGFLVEGHAPPPNAGAETQVVEVSVTPGFFEAMRIPLRYGRDFSAADRANTLPVVIVDDAFARRFWAGSDAIGKRMRFTGDTTMQTIIGVVSSVRDEDVAAEGRPHAYQPYTQLPSQRPSLVISTAGDPSSVVAAVRRAISELEPGAPLVNVRPISDAVAQTLQNRRLTELLLSGFALLAVALAAVGIYGVMTLYVASRTREFGIRLAVGAEPSRLVRLVLGEGLVLASTGVVLGVAAALVATRWLLAILYEVSPTDPVVFSTLAVGLLAVAAAACYRPARRAAGVDPQVALRGE